MALWALKSLLGGAGSRCGHFWHRRCAGGGGWGDPITEITGKSAVLETLIELEDGKDLPLGLRVRAYLTQ